VALATFLAEQLRSASLNYSYRFLFIPGTIGSITWLALNHDRVLNIRHGLVVTSVGDSGPFTYKRTRQGNAEIDEAVAHVFRHSGRDFEIQEFFPYGYDERQYCSPGFNLAVGALSRTPHGRYPEYHTSADNLDFVRPESLADSLSVYLSVLRVLEWNKKYMSQNPYCEPQLGKRGLYRDIGAGADDRANELALLWVLNLSDGSHTVLDIADRSGLQFEVVRNAADLLTAHGLLAECLGETPQAGSKR
jgi:aminopeptidase-like protein